MRCLSRSPSRRSRSAWSWARRASRRAWRSSWASCSVRAYYDDAANARRFQSPESVTMEYLVLDLPSVERGISIAEDDLR
ncbi:hypothetical protein, partial [Sphaerotilus sulfidivorans]|uniref:hypothetical protein n=1 Tax=Sphaerotilus sulfidivorans TaxID=639200 RepID=UPI0015DB0B34